MDPLLTKTLNLQKDESWGNPNYPHFFFPMFLINNKDTLSKKSDTSDYQHLLQRSGVSRSLVKARLPRHSKVMDQRSK